MSTFMGLHACTKTFLVPCKHWSATWCVMTQGFNLLAPYFATLALSHFCSTYLAICSIAVLQAPHVTKQKKHKDLSPSVSASVIIWLCIMMSSRSAEQNTRGCDQLRRWTSTRDTRNDIPTNKKWLHLKGLAWLWQTGENLMEQERHLKTTLDMGREDLQFTPPLHPEVLLRNESLRGLKCFKHAAACACAAKMGCSDTSLHPCAQT